LIGDPEDVKAFRYACSSAINPIENWVFKTLFPDDDGPSPMNSLGKMILNGEMVDMFTSNGYLVMKSDSNDLFLVFDPETGIVRDMMIVHIPLSGAYCYSNLQTEWASDLGEELLNNPPAWLDMVGGINLGLGSSLLGMDVTPFEVPEVDLDSW